MPILQNKLVMKSIEALHDEALSLMPDTASNRGITAPPAVLHAAKPPQESPIDMPKDTSGDAPPESAGEHDIMARIDHLLKKLDEVEDVADKPLADEGPQSNMEKVTVDDSHTATAQNIATDNLANTDSTVLSDAANSASVSPMLNVAVGGIAEDMADKPFSETGHEASNNATDDASNDMRADDQPAETASRDQTQALADIAEAIYQSQQQSVDTVNADARQNNGATLDMDVLSATVADEVRRTVSAVMAAEIPKMVREAVGEAFRALPADARVQSASTTGNPSRAKSVDARKTANTKKALAKKAGTKKSTSKKATNKTVPKKKLNTKKSQAKKTTTKKPRNKHSSVDM